MPQGIKPSPEASISRRVAYFRMTHLNRREVVLNYFSGGQGQKTACDTAQTSTWTTPSTPAASHELQTPLSQIFSHSPYHDASKPICYGDVVANLLELMSTMTGKFLSALMQTLFWQYISALYDDEIKKFVPSDFIDLCCNGIHVLNKNGKEDILYYQAKGLRTPRADESGPCLPINRMPFWTFKLQHPLLCFRFCK